MEIRYIDRLSGKEEREKVYGHIYLKLLYGSQWYCRLFSSFLLPLFAHVPLFSKLYGAFQKSRLSRRKIIPFINKFGVDTSEFADPVNTFESFNDFFIRKLKPACRPMKDDESVAVMPADARYLVYPQIGKSEGFWVKGKKFSLEKLLQDPLLAEKYASGTMVIARLCPTDYHRFHFPFACTPRETQCINGPLFSVNPIALKRNISILSENKRAITLLETVRFGDVAYIEVGATYVGSIHQTFAPDKPAHKGEEKGYFSFGGSCLILLFEPSRILLDADLIDASQRYIEVRGLLGQSLGTATNRT